MNPRSIDINDYSYDLPKERIAKFPLGKRDASKLLVYREGHISESIFHELPDLLPPGALMVFNNTRVVHARILFRRDTGAEIEIFCLEPLGHPDHQQAFAATGSSEWKCMIGNAKRWKEDFLVKDIPAAEGNIRLKVEKTGETDGLFHIRFSWGPAQLHFSEVLHEAGQLPLPPYLERENTESDEDDYQTIYARLQGSVAAPTAGLHFTGEVFEKLAAKGIHQSYITLHVGAGTFRPVKAEQLGDHTMHEEKLFITRESIAAIRNCMILNGPVVAVGTTSVRVIESLYWYGVKLIKGHQDTVLDIRQWDPYSMQAEAIAPAQALDAILEMMDREGLDALNGGTGILIAPGYEFRIVDILVTNFHQPGNTLILLVAAFTGNDWKRIYEYALQHDFRFLSYGDSSLLFRNKLRTA